jgi:hypothetical protein
LTLLVARRPAAGCKFSLQLLELIVRA